MTTKQLTQFDEVKAGDRVLVLDASKIDHSGRLETGQVYDVRNVDSDGDFRLNAGDGYVYILKHERRGLAKVEGKDPVIERLDTLEKLVREQGDLIRQMKAQQDKKREPIRLAPGMFASVEPIAVEVISQNTLRRRAIEAAKKDVRSISNEYRTVKFEFFVNEKKRVVTAIAKSPTGTVVSTAMAKASPGDVFNAEIGKAIALRRLLRRKIPTSLTHAIQPDKVVVGHMMDVGEPELYEIVESGASVSKNKAQLGSFYGSLGSARKIHKIMSDTKAQY